MAGKRFTPVTGILILCIGYGVYLAGHTVNPPPPGPPLPVPAPKPPTEADRKAKAAEHAEMVKQEKVSEASQKVNAKNLAKGIPPKFNPNSVDITPTYWQENDMGNHGVALIDKKVADAKVKQNAQIQAIVKKNAVDKPPAK